MYTKTCLLVTITIFLVRNITGILIDSKTIEDVDLHDVKSDNLFKLYSKRNVNTNVNDKNKEKAYITLHNLQGDSEISNFKQAFEIGNEIKDSREAQELMKDNSDVAGVNHPKLTIAKVNLTAEEPCIGYSDYCNLSKEEYIAMMQDYIYPHTYEWVLIGTHTLVFVIGLIGNALVCISVYRNHTMRTVTNYFIVNLAVADFMVILFCLPPTVVWDVTETWFLGNALCKIILYFQSVSVTVSVLTLTFISVDRWYAICFPLKFKSTTGRAKTAILIIWAVALSFNLPELIVLEEVQTVPLRFELEYLVQCMATWSPTSEVVWHILKVLFIYTIPLLLMTVAYHQIVKVLWKNEKIPGHAETMKLAPAEQTQLRSRRKAAKMLVAVVIMFAVCYFPIHLLCILRYTVDLEQNDAVTFLALLSHVLCYANSAINPLIYNFMSGKFRREFRRSFRCTDSSVPENFTTLTRMTTMKARRPCAFTELRPHSGVCTTQFIQNHHPRDYVS